MKNILSLVAVLSLALALPAQASEAPAGNIVRVYGMLNGALLFNTTAARTSAPPACQQDPGLAQRWAIDASTVAGQTAASVLLTAYALKKKVFVLGTGNCSIWGDTETVAFILIED